MINAPYLEKRHWAKVQWSSSCPVTLGDSCGMGKRVPGSLKLSCPSPASSSLVLHSSASCCCVRSDWRGSDGLQHKVGKTEQKWLKLSRFLSLPSFLWFVRKKVNIQGFSCELLWKVERILCSVKTPSKANAPVSTFTLLRGIPSAAQPHSCPHGRWVRRSPNVIGPWTGWTYQWGRSNVSCWRNSWVFAVKLWLYGKQKVDSMN